MNKHLSVLALAARQTIGKVLALLAAMTAAETRRSSKRENASSAKAAISPSSRPPYGARALSP